MKGNGPLRVLVIDDDPVYRRIVSQTLVRIPNVEVAGTASTIALAQARLAGSQIDAVTLDVVMNGESGLQLLPWLHHHHPSMVTVLLTAGSQRDACQAVDALLLGASALVIKPIGASAPALLLERLARVLLGSAPEQLRPARPANHHALPPPKGPALREVITIGASTGGPPVVLGLLKQLPKNFAVPILIAQHMPALHIPYYAELLGEQSGRRVQVAVNGHVIEPGTVYVAPGGQHMRVARAFNQLILRTDAGPEEHNCRPAVDPLFRSAAEVCGEAVVGVVISGMGSDGALGALALRARGAVVVAQDEASSVVWGMPGATVTAGAADAIAPATELAAHIERFTSGHLMSNERRSNS